MSKVLITITEEQEQNLLCSAIEGGSNYWYLFGKEAMSIINKHVTKNTNSSFVDSLWAAIKLGLSIPVRDVEHNEVIGEISLASIEKGEKILAEKHTAHLLDIIGENDDATTGDVWFQLCVLGELVYG